MKKGKFLVVVMATALVAVMAGSSLCHAGAPLTKKETYSLGKSGCSLEVTIDVFDGHIISAFITGAAGCPTGPVSPEFIAQTIMMICPDTVDGLPGNCAPLTFVQKNIMVKTGENSTYYYYTSTGQRIKVTTP